VVDDTDKRVGSQECLVSEEIAARRARIVKLYPIWITLALRPSYLEQNISAKSCSGMQTASTPRN
jgi:hypothetical protein